MQKKISLSFNSAWILSKKDEEKLPVEAFVDSVKGVLDVEILDTSLTECEIVIKSENASEADIKNEIVSLIKKVFAIEDLTDVVECSVSEYTPVKTEDAPKQEAEAAPAVAEEACDKVAGVMAKIHALVGAEEFKALADECVRIAPGLIKHNALESFTHRCYLFAINDGYGLTTHLKLFAELLGALGLFRFNEKTPVAEERLPAKDVDGSAFSDVFAHFNRYGSDGGRIVSVDISEWMTRITEKSFRDFLSRLDDRMGENIVVFRVPFVEKEILNGLRKGLSDLLFVRDVSFVPFDQEELIRCAEDALRKRGYTMEEGAWDVFRARITEEKNDGRFYGINTVNKVILETIYRKQLHNALDGVDDAVIKKAEILDLAPSYSVHEKTGLELLDSLIGMQQIRDRVAEIVAQIEMATKNSTLGSPCIHMRFVGNPGTGKTTVARVIGQILKERGILRNGNFFEHAGRDFCGRFVGETSPKTAAMCRDAYGSVLFIDEAYALYRGDSYGSADYGREVIDTLISEMENHRSDLVVIMAGYTDEMNTLMKANAGLESRMPFVIEFPNYTREQLFQIFMLMANKSFRCGEGFEEAVKAYFDSLPEEVIQSKEFSNARFVRNLFERTWGKTVLRAQLNKADASLLTREDFLLASSEKEFKKIMQKQNRTLGFI